MRYLIYCLLLAGMACSTPQAATPEVAAPAPPPATSPAPSYAGDYDLKVMDTPAGTVSGTLSLSEGDGDELSGTITVNGNAVDLREVNRTDDGITLKFYSSDYQMDIDMRLKGAPGANELSGTALNSYMTVATRKM